MPKVDTISSIKVVPFWLQKQNCDLTKNVNDNIANFILLSMHGNLKEENIPCR